MAEIAFRGIHKRYPAVRDMNLEIADGEFMILVGPSGCGKSTALRMVAGLEDITGGELIIGGRRMNERAPRERDVALVHAREHGLRAQARQGRQGDETAT